MFGEQTHGPSGLTNLICRTMPTAAVASGFMSVVDQTAKVEAAIAAGHTHDAVEAWGGMGLSKVRAYCAAHGLDAGDAFPKALRKRLLMDRMREEYNRLREHNQKIRDADLDEMAEAFGEVYKN